MRLTQVHMKQFEELQPYVDTLVLPIGTIEAHGPHAPLGTDMLIPSKLADIIESKLGGRIWTAPPIPYGHNFHLRDFPGTIDVPQRIFADYVHAVVSSFAQWGIKNVVLLNGHGGNMTALNEVANCLADQGLYVLLSNYWLDYQAEIREIAPGVGHAGEDETSLAMAVAPGTVDLSLAGEHTVDVPRGVRFPNMGRAMYPQALSGNAAAASAEKGERLLDLISERLTQEILALWKQNS